MNRSKFQRCWAAGWLAVTTTALIAGDFAPPAEGPVAFRRDRIPLDTDALSSLSNNLVALAQAQKFESPENRRSVAQMLALSSALDPGNSNARTAISNFTKSSKQDKPKTNAKLIQEHQDGIWKILAWLETPEAGKQGNALAACLSDVVIQSNPQHPKALKENTKAERGAWNQWIPPLSAYRAPDPVKPSIPKVETKPDLPRFPLNKASVGTVFMLSGKHSNRPPIAEARVSQRQNNRSFIPIQVSMSTKAPVEDADIPASEALAIEIVPSPDPGTFQPFTHSLLKLLKPQSTTLPAGTIAIQLPTSVESINSSVKLLDISAAIAVLANAAITGNEPGGIILGCIDANGAFTLPKDFWNRLRAQLDLPQGGRVILPAAAAEYLPSFLALETPQVFMNYEIVLADDFQGLVKLASKKPEPTTAAAYATFQEIRRKMGTSALGSYVANPYVKKRLIDIFRDMPNHVSSKMLAIQGAGNRPTVISRLVLAAELSRAIEPMEWIIRNNSYDFLPEDQVELAPTSDLCRSQVDQLSRYVAKEDRALFDEVQSMVICVRTLERASRGRGEYGEVHNALYSAYSALLAAYKSTNLELNSIINPKDGTQ